MPVLSLACHLPHNTPNIPSRYNNEQTTKQTKAINNSYIYIYISHVNVTQTVPDISPLMPMHQDPLLVNNWMRSADIRYLKLFVIDVAVKHCDKVMRSRYLNPFQLTGTGLHSVPIRYKAILSKPMIPTVNYSIGNIFRLNLYSKSSHPRKQCFWKYCLQNVGHFLIVA